MAAELRFWQFRLAATPFAVKGTVEMALQAPGRIPLRLHRAAAPAASEKWTSVCVEIIPRMRLRFGVCGAPTASLTPQEAERQVSKNARTSLPTEAPFKLTLIGRVNAPSRWPCRAASLGRQEPPPLLLPRPHPNQSAQA